MKPQFKADLNMRARIVELTMNGLFSEDDMRDACIQLKEITDRFGGKRHITIADMRGMKTVHPTIAAILGEAIGYQRSRGCVLCLHVSDDTVQRLQVARVARQYSESDEMTVDAASIEVARSLARSYSRYLDDPKFRSSLRDAIAAR